MISPGEMGLVVIVIGKGDGISGSYFDLERYFEVDNKYFEIHDGRWNIFQL